MKHIRFENVDHDYVPALKGYVGIGGIVFAPLEWQDKKVLVVLVEGLE